MLLATLVVDHGRRGETAAPALSRRAVRDLVPALDGLLIRRSSLGYGRPNARTNKPAGATGLVRAGGKCASGL